jgi:hypothetical protein
MAGSANRTSFGFGEDAYRCPAGETPTSRYSNVEEGWKLHCYWTTNCAGCALKSKCTPSKERGDKAAPARLVRTHPWRASRTTIY